MHDECHNPYIVFFFSKFDRDSGLYVYSIYHLLIQIHAKKK